MGHINTGRMVLGGLAAGVIINIVAFIVNGILLKDDWAAAMTALNRPSEMTTGQIVGFNIWGFLVGQVAVWLYAAIRPRFSAGPATAVKAGLATWFLGYFLANAGPYITGMLPANLLTIDTLGGLVGIVVGTVVGARIYQESALPAEDLRTRSAGA